MTTEPAVWAGPTRARLYPEIEFGGYSCRDGTVAFYSRVAALVGPTSRVVDYACGAGSHLSAQTPFVYGLQRLRGRVAEVIGVDIDLDSARNPHIDRFVASSGTAVPLDEGTIDAIVCDWGVEHMADVGPFFAECRRLLRPGGVVCIRTPNRFHYSSLGARVVPFTRHHSIRRLLGQFHSDSDVFPVFYRCNTRARLHRELSRHGFSAAVYAHRGESHLSGMGLAAGWVGELIERLSPPLLWHELHAFGRRVERSVRPMLPTSSMEGPYAHRDVLQ